MRTYTAMMENPAWGPGYYDIFVCELTAANVDSAIKEYNRYRNREGEFYNKHPYESSCCRNFVKYYFGDYDEHGDYDTPTRFICTNKNVATRLLTILKDLEFHDSINKLFCVVEQDGKSINIVRGEW